MRSVELDRIGGHLALLLGTGLLKSPNPSQPPVQRSKEQPVTRKHTSDEGPLPGGDHS